MAMREKAPVTITLGNINKLFGKKGTADKRDQALLGEAYDDYYGDLADSCKVKVRNYVKQDQSDAYNQSYQCAERLYHIYFSEDGAKRSQLPRIRAHILETWRNRLDSPCPGYQETARLFLTDHTLRFSQAGSVREYRAFLDLFQKAENPDDQAEFLTVATLLSVTRGKWADIPPALILPEHYTERQPLTAAEANEPLRQAEQTYRKGNYQEAADLLEQLGGIPDESAGPDRQEEIRRFNCDVYYLLSQAYRKLREQYEETAPEYREFTESIRYALEEAADNGSVPAMLETARDYFSRQPAPAYDPDPDLCVQMCEKLIRTDGEAKACGEAYWMLYFLEKDDEKALSYLKKSADYGYEKAVREWNEREAVSLVQVIRQSADDSAGIYYVNTDSEHNEQARLLRKTAPKGWTEMPWPLPGDGLDGRYPDDRDRAWPPSEKRIPVGAQGGKKYFLLSDDREKNLREFLYLLQSVKENTPDEPVIPAAFYIRGQEEKISPFIDTALARMGSRIIPVQILDDDKIAARVLARHPLFYPIRSLRQNQQARLNFAVIGHTPCCEWLIREAFWMLTFRNPNITAEIRILGPEAEKLEKKLRFLCPGIDSGGLPGEALPKIFSFPCSYESSDLSREIENAANSGYAYYAVDTGSDTENTALAVKIRESTIREALRPDRDHPFTPDFPVITFRCQDPDIANLSRRTVVINEDSGTNWFNQYGIIPFGSIDQLYHWDALTNDIFDRLSLNIHLQYYLDQDFDIHSNPEGYEQQYLSALRDFCGRTYNRDSSMAVAMSLPYRMYQGEADGKPILPSGTDPLHHRRLDILDPETFYSEEALNTYIWFLQKAGWAQAAYTKIVELKRGNDYNKWRQNDPLEAVEEEDPDSEFYQLAQWEHRRWNRFMISRGWVGAQTDQMKRYHAEGNKRQQLYVARMHPCITDFSKISALDRTWSRLSGKKSTFKQNDLTTIQMTEHILGMKWTRAAEEYFRAKARDGEERG